MKTGPTFSRGRARKWRWSVVTAAAPPSITKMESLLWGAIEDKARSERCEG